jgi:hypothetical protein
MAAQAKLAPDPYMKIPGFNPITVFKPKARVLYLSGYDKKNSIRIRCKPGIMHQLQKQQKPENMAKKP